MAENDSTNSLEKLIEDIREGYKGGRRIANKFVHTSGFFSPYKNKADFLKTLVSPIAAPLVLLGLLVFFAVVATGAAVFCVGALVVGLCAFPFNYEFATSALWSTLTALGVASVAMVGTIAFAVLVPTSTFVNVINIFTRAGATIAEALGFLAQSDEESQIENAHEQSVEVENEEKEGLTDSANAADLDKKIQIEDANDHADKSDVEESQDAGVQSEEKGSNVSPVTSLGMFANSQNPNQPPNDYLVDEVFSMEF